MAPCVCACTSDGVFGLAGVKNCGKARDKQFEINARRSGLAMIVNIDLWSNMSSSPIDGRYSECKQRMDFAEEEVL